MTVQDITVERYPLRLDRLIRQMTYILIEQGMEKNEAFETVMLKLKCGESK